VKSPSYDVGPPLGAARPVPPCGTRPYLANLTPRLRRNHVLTQIAPTYARVARRRAIGSFPSSNGLSLSHILCWTPGVRALLMPNEPRRGGLAQPRPTAWVREPVPFLAASPERAKYHCGAQVDDRPAPSWWIYYALSGLGNASGINFLTQAVGLGYVSSPLRG